MSITLPEKFETRMKNILNEEYEIFKNSILSQKNVRGLRVNTKKISVSDFLKICPYNLKKLSYNKDGFILLDENLHMGGEVCHQAGMFYMQEPAAMIPINSIDIKKNWKVLDLCAAPGGKTAQISNQLDGEGFVIANDIKFDRCKALVVNTERLGLENVIITSAKSEDICKNFLNYFDLVLVDATCSGEGMFRKNPNLISTWSEKNIQRCCSIQKELLSNVAKTIKKSGLLIYSTCTYSIEENENIVYEFLKSNPAFKLIDVKEEIKQVTKPGIKINNEFPFEKTRRFYPHFANGEGQYVAVFEKTETCGDSKAVLKKISNSITPEIENFLKETGVEIDKERIQIKGNKIWVLPKSKIMLTNNVVNYGVKLGEFSNGVIIPSHSFFMAFGHLFKNKIEFSINDLKLAQYLEGKNIKMPCKNGWGVIQVNNCTIGGFHCKNNNLINYYPKNLTNKDIFE